MNSELTNKLIEEFPKLYKKDFHFEIGDGWYKLVYDLSKELQNYNIIAIQVKEKFGGLRYYISEIEDKEVSDKDMKKIYELINKAEEKSTSICERSGLYGKIRNVGGWLRCLCDQEYELVMLGLTKDQVYGPPKI